MSSSEREEAVGRGRAARAEESPTTRSTAGPHGPGLFPLGAPAAGAQSVRPPPGAHSAPPPIRRPPTPRPLAPLGSPRPPLAHRAGGRSDEANRGGRVRRHTKHLPRKGLSGHLGSSRGPSEAALQGGLELSKTFM